MSVAPDKTQLIFTLEDDGGISMRFACKSGWITSEALSGEGVAKAGAEGGMTVGRMLLIVLEAGMIQHIKGLSYGGRRKPGCGCDDAMTMLGIIGSLAKAAPQTERV